ncbi:MAG: hypothetical protein HKO57_09240 [Akkermansiaceae bacterium]|nr:hypothetical protein [Akkermansiaceae bacterium]
MGKSDEESARILQQQLRRRMDIVAQRFVEGMSVPNIVNYLRHNEGIEVARDVPYQDLGRVTARRWLKYEPPMQELLSGELKSRYALKDVYVPSYGERMAVVSSGARLCAESIWKIAKAKAKGQAQGHPESGTERWNFPVEVPDPNLGSQIVPHKPGLAAEYTDKREREALRPRPLVIPIHIGFSGGVTMARAAEQLRFTLARRVEDWEKRLKGLVLDWARNAGAHPPTEGILKHRFKVQVKFTLVNLVSGFDVDPRTNPIAFLTDFLRDEVLEPRTKLELFNAMPFMETGAREVLFWGLEALGKFRNRWKRERFDVILTSGSSIDDEHTMFRRYYDSEELTKILADLGVEGDFLWMPVRKEGPAKVEDLRDEVAKIDGKLAALLDYEPMSLLTLEEVQEHVRGDEERGNDGGDVFLILNPCSVCLKEKSRIAKAVLGLPGDQCLVTHFVCDEQTAMATLDLEDLPHPAEEDDAETGGSREDGDAS